VLSLSSLLAQPAGYLGKRMGVSVGATLNPVLIGMPTSESLNYERTNTLLPPKLSIGAEYVIGNRWSVTGAISRFPMPDFNFHVTTNTGNESVVSTVTDSFQVRSNMSSLHVGFRLYKEYAPYGRYYSFGIGGSRVSSILYTTTFEGVSANGTLQSGTITKLEPGDYTTNLPSIYFGKGRQAIAFDRFTIDYGARFYWFFGNLGSPSINAVRGGGGSVVAYGHRLNLEDLVKHLVNTRALETHFLEFHLNVGFIK